MSSSSIEVDALVAETQNSGLFQFEPGLNKAISLRLQDQEYTQNMKEVQLYLERVKKIVKPGCSQEVLNKAVNSMSSVVRTLSVLSSKPKPHSSL